MSPENRGRMPTAGVGFLGRGQQTPFPPVRVLEKHCELPGGVRGRAPTAQRFSTIFSTEDRLSWQYNCVYCASRKKNWKKYFPIQSWVNFCAFDDAVWCFFCIRQERSLVGKVRHFLEGGIAHKWRPDKTFLGVTVDRQSTKTLSLTHTMNVPNSNVTHQTLRAIALQWLKWSCEAGGAHLTKPGWSKPHNHSPPI